MLYILWVKVRDWATFSSGLPLIAKERVTRRDFFGNTFLERLPLVFFLFCIQSLYFPINQSGSSAVRLDIAWLDGVMPLVGIFVVPYLLGLILIGSMGLLFAAVLTRAQFQEFTLALLVVMLVGFSIWILLPASIYKEPFTPTHLFEEWTYDLHQRDEHYGNHNSFPSSHVYYITLAMYSLARRWRQWWFLFGTLAVINAWSTLLTHQHYFVDVLAGLLLTLGGIWVTRHIFLPRLQAWEASQAERNFYG